MRQPLLPVIALLALAALGLAAFASFRPQPRAAGGTGATTAAALERLTREVGDLAARQAALESSLERLSKSSALVAPSGGRVSVGDIEAAVARWMESNGEAAAAVQAAAPAPEGELPRADRVAAALARLDDPELDAVEVQALWRQFAAEGLTADLVAAYEARAEAAPNDPDAQVDAAGAYLAKIVEVGNSPEAGMWATKADRAYDRALAIDDHHWEARFEKAVALSFWPPVFGKQGEAIKQFEILVEQQAGQPPEPRHAQTHLLLGNMYRQIGEEERAAAAWQRGLERYPGDEALLGQLEVFSSDG